MKRKCAAGSYGTPQAIEISESALEEVRFRRAIDGEPGLEKTKLPATSEHTLNLSVRLPHPNADRDIPLCRYIEG